MQFGSAGASVSLLLHACSEDSPPILSHTQTCHKRSKAHPASPLHSQPPLKSVKYPASQKRRAPWGRIGLQFRAANDLLVAVCSAFHSSRHRSGMLQAHRC